MMVIVSRNEVDILDLIEKSQPISTRQLIKKINSKKGLKTYQNQSYYYDKIIKLEKQGLISINKKNHEITIPKKLESPLTAFIHSFNRLSATV